MAGTAILYSAPSGVPGDLNDILNTVVESWVLDPDLTPTDFGVPVKVVDGKIAKIESGDTAADFYGILSRSVPTMAPDLNVNLNTSTPNANTVSGVVVGGPGYVLVKCTVGTPAKGGAVYMRVTAALGKAVGDLEATPDGGNSVLLTNVIWAVAGKDSNNVSAVRVSVN
jgi:hypothetical protein